MNTTLDPSQIVTLPWRGRSYGMPRLSLEQRYKVEPAPEIGKIFLEDLITKSAILALPADPSVEAIFSAYSEDITAIELRRKESDTFLFQVLACAMDYFNVDESKRNSEVEALTKLLVPLGIMPQIALTAEKCALPARELTAWLKAEFLTEMDRIARRIAVTLHYLADQHVVGLVDWKSSEILKFHYFTWSVEHSSTTSQKRTGDVMAWNTLTTTQVDTAKIERARHTHHVIRAAVHSLADYKQPMPRHIEALLTHAPVFLRKHLLVVDGTEVLSEKASEIAGESVKVSTTSVTRYDPAITFGSFVFGGWSADDLLPESQTNRDTPKKSSWTFSWPVAFGLMVVIGCVCAIFYALNKVEKSSFRAYQNYLAVQPVSSQVMTARDGERIMLPVEYSLVFKGNFSRESTSVRLMTYSYVGNEQKPVFREVMLPSKHKGTAYGDVDLRHSLGIPVILHVRSLEDGKLSYTTESAGSNMKK